MPTDAYLEDLRLRLVDLTENMSDYSDSDLRNIKNTADVFSMKIRRELIARDVRMVKDTK